MMVCKKCAKAQRFNLDKEIKKYKGNFVVIEQLRSLRCKHSDQIFCNIVKGAKQLQRRKSDV